MYSRCARASVQTTSQPSTQHLHQGVPGKILINQMPLYQISRYIRALSSCMAVPYESTLPYQTSPISDKNSQSHILSISSVTCTA
jgi:hypothetical protein